MINPKLRYSSKSTFQHYKDYWDDLVEETFKDVPKENLKWLYFSYLCGILSLSVSMINRDTYNACNEEIKLVYKELFGVEFSVREHN